MPKRFRMAVACRLLPAGPGAAQGSTARPWRECKRPCRNRRTSGRRARQRNRTTRQSHASGRRARATHLGGASATQGGLQGGAPQGIGPRKRTMAQRKARAKGTGQRTARQAARPPGTVKRSVFRRPPCLSRAGLPDRLSGPPRCCRAHPWRRTEKPPCACPREASSVDRQPRLLARPRQAPQSSVA